MTFKRCTNVGQRKKNSIILRQGTPNPTGAFQSLYVLEGDLACFEQKKDLQIAAQVIPPPTQLQIGNKYSLKILHFNDLHNNLRASSSSHGDTYYMSQMVKIVNEARRKAAPSESVLFLSAGDDHTGNPLDELLGTNVETFQASAPYRAYSVAGLDAAVLGNHEFDRGSALLAKAIAADAQFPVLSANIFGSQYLTKDHYSPAIIGITTNGIRVGIIGLTTKISTRLGTSEDPLSDASDMAETIAHIIPYVEPFADVIVILSHVGYNGKVEGIPRHVLELGDVQIANAAAMVTDMPMVLVGGHTHTVLNENSLVTIVNNIPVVQAGSYGSHLGEFNFSLLPTEALLRTDASACLHKLKRRDQRAATLNAPDYNPSQYEQDSDLDLAFEATVMQPLYDMLSTKLDEILAQAGSGDNLTTHHVLENRYIGQTAIHNFMNDAIVAHSRTFPIRSDHTRQVDIAVLNGSGVSSGVVPNAPISFEDWFQVMPFADLIVVLSMTGAEIKQMLMSNAQRIVRAEQLAINGGSATPEGLKGFAYSYGFLHFSKDLKYTIQLNDSAVNAVAINIRLQGQPIDTVLDQTFRVAFSDFIALRGGGSENWRGQTTKKGQPALGFDLTTLPKDETGLVCRNEIIEYIRSIGVVDVTTGAAIDDRLMIV